MATAEFKWTPKDLAVNAASEMRAIAFDELLRMYRDRFDGEDCDDVGLRLRAVFLRFSVLSRAVISALNADDGDLQPIVEQVTGLIE